MALSKGDRLTTAQALTGSFGNTLVSAGAEGTIINVYEAHSNDPRYVVQFDAGPLINVYHHEIVSSDTSDDKVAG
ncbi:MAG TPA: hypothetical protein VLI05_02775 [Candidatus Saccharimonadia bacterium]|nr:hypothetical protein [Candidatus Saccharimonadia bacterium]